MQKQRQKKILIIDDEEDFLRFIKMRFSKAGFHVLTATRAVEGIRLAKKRLPTVILLDIKMPEVSGLEVLNILKSHPETASVPIVMFSALGDETTKREASYYYAEDYLTKPFEGQELVRKIEGIVSRREHCYLG